MTTAQVGAAGLAGFACTFGYGRRIPAGSDGGADRHRLAHAQENLHRGLGGSGCQLQFIQQGVALRG